MNRKKKGTWALCTPTGGVSGGRIEGFPLVSMYYSAADTRHKIQDRLPCTKYLNESNNYGILQDF